MGTERVAIIPGACLIISGLAFCRQSPQQRTELPTDPTEIATFAASHCDKTLRMVYSDTTIPQKIYEGCIMQSVDQLSSPFYRFLSEHNQDIIGSSIIFGGIILAVLPLIIRGRARLGLR